MQILAVGDNHGNYEGVGIGVRGMYIISDIRQHFLMSDHLLLILYNFLILSIIITVPNLAVAYARFKINQKKLCNSQDIVDKYNKFGFSFYLALLLSLFTTSFAALYLSDIKMIFLIVFIGFKSMPIMVTPVSILASAI